jgi:MFS family permease
MAAWTAIARRAFGANRFGALIAMYNSAIAIGSASFNGVASAATGGGGGGGGGVGAWRAVFWAAAVASAGAVFVGAVATREMRRLAETSFEYVSVK